jgi:hypothetical protein
MWLFWGRLTETEEAGSGMTIFWSSSRSLMSMSESHLGNGDPSGDGVLGDRQSLRHHEGDAGELGERDASGERLDGGADADEDEDDHFAAHAAPARGGVEAASDTGAHDA